MKQIYSILFVFVVLFPAVKTVAVQTENAPVGTTPVKLHFIFA